MDFKQGWRRRALQHWWRHPPINTPTMAVCVGGGIILTAIAVGVSSWTSGTSPTLAAVLRPLSLVFVVLCCALLHWRRCAPRWVLHATIATGSLAVLAVELVAHASGDGSRYAVCWSMAVVVAVGTCSGRSATLHVIAAMTTVTAYAAAAGPSTWGDLMVLAGCIVTAAVVQAALLVSMDAARRDELTGLLGRAEGAQRLREALADFGAGGRPVAVALMDVDHFKQVNDSAGHAAGDRLLAGVAAAWMAQSLVDDLQVRWGGDEFVVATRGPAVDFMARVDAVRVALPVGVSFSAGVTVAVAGEGLDVVMQRADEALYAVKRGGRGRAQLVVASGKG